MEIFMKKESWTNLELAQPVKEGHLVEERMSEKEEDLINFGTKEPTPKQY